MKLRPLIGLSLFAPFSASAALVAGDISIIGYRSDSTDAISFVVWTTVDAGTTIHFTDSGFFDDGTLRSSEEAMSWTAPTGGIAAGTVIAISSPSSGNSSANIGSTSGKLSGLVDGGDQLFSGTTAFSTSNVIVKPGATYSGTLLFGLDFSGSAGWDLDSTDTQTSALPASLSSSSLNFSIAHVDNAQFMTSFRTQDHTVAAFKALIADPANWSTSNDGGAFGPLSTTSFSIVPEPASSLAAGLLLAAGTARRRRQTA